MKAIKGIHHPRYLMGVVAAVTMFFAAAHEGLGVTTDTQYIIESGIIDFSIEVGPGPRLEFEVNNLTGDLFMTADQQTGRMTFGDTNVNAVPRRAFHFLPTADGSDASILVDNEDQAGVAPRNMFELRNNGGPRFVLRDTSFSTDRFYTFALNPEGHFVITRGGVPGVEFILKNNGVIEMGPGTATVFRVTDTGVQATSYDQLSDREAKREIEELSSEEVLSKIREVPVSSWRFKGEDDSSLHIGPMAQDFREAFGTGTSDRVINVGDLAGVALAGVRSLSEELEARDAEVGELRAALKERDGEMREMRARLDKERTRSSALEERIERLEELLHMPVQEASRKF